MMYETNKVIQEKWNKLITELASLDELDKRTDVEPLEKVIKCQRLFFKFFNLGMELVAVTS